MIQLRPYQARAIDETRAAYKARHRAVLMVLPTGGGKTYTASTIVHGASAKGNVTWWLTHRRELAAQASQTFHGLGIPHGTVQAGHVSNPHACVQVASIQTIVRRLDALPAPDLIVFDECVAGESVVETDRGPMMIRDIKADGTMALCQVDGELTFRPITKAWKSGNRRTLRICLSNGNEVICTPDHRFYLDGQWTEAQNLKVGQQLASPAAFANAAAAARSRATVEAGRAPMRRATKISDPALTGMRDLLRSLLTPRPALVDAVSKFRQLRLTPKHFVNGGAASLIGRSSWATTNAPPVSAFNLVSSSDLQFSARCLGMEASASRIQGRQTRGSHGHMVSRKRLGFTTKALLFGGCGLSSTLRAMLASARSVFECTRHASHASLKSAASWLPKGPSASLANGSMRLAMSGLHGGIATTGIGQTASISIPRDTRKPKTASLLTGWGRHQSSIMGKGTPTSAFIALDHSNSSSASAHLSPNVWSTNCPTIERIEAGPTVDVYDLTVEQAHNFFANGVLVHNCHHIGAASWSAIFNRFPQARVLGLTATPWRLDGVGLGNWFTAMVLGPTTAELIAEGALSPYRLFAPATPDLSGIAMAQGDYQRGALAKAMDKPQIVGDAIGHYSRLCAGKRAVAFAAGVENSQHIAAQFRAAGIAAEHVDGAMSVDERDAAVERFRRGETLVLSNADLFGEGFDVPAIEAAILLRPTKSLSLHLQQVGRALRPCEGKSEAVILDHAGNSLTHGLPDDDREWSLEDRERRKRAAPSEVSIKQCDNCFFVHRPAPKCPQCGTVYEVKARAIEVVDGELAEVRKVAQQRQRRMEEADCHTLDDWRALAQQRGYKPGWAMHRWQARQRRAA